VVPQGGEDEDAGGTRKRLGGGQDSRLPAEFNLTPYLHPGENVIAAQVMRYCDGSYLEDQDFLEAACQAQGWEVERFCPDDLPGIETHPSWLSGRDYSGGDRRYRLCRRAYRDIGGKDAAFQSGGFFKLLLFYSARRFGRGRPGVMKYRERPEYDI
jgi:hypothetical protein